MLYLTSDHGGFELKKKIAKYLMEKGIPFENLGPHSFDPEDDYPDYAVKAIEKVKENLSENKAILMCKSGTGEVIVANKFKGIRASLSWNKQHAIKAREHENANVLALPADYISDEEAFKTVEAWLNTEFSEEERHVRRLGKIDKIEE